MRARESENNGPAISNHGSARRQRVDFHLSTTRRAALEEAGRFSVSGRGWKVRERTEEARGHRLREKQSRSRNGSDGESRAGV